MNTFILIMNLVVGIFGIALIWLGYQKDKTSKPEAKAILGKKILILTLVMAILNLIQPLIKHFSPKPPPAATKEDIESLRADLRAGLNKLSEPTQEQVESELDLEFESEFEKKEKNSAGALPQRSWRR